MTTIQDEILEEFYRRLEKADGFTESKMKQVRELLSGSKKPKAADLMSVFSANPKGNLP